MHIVDITDPTYPRAVGHWRDEGYATSVAVAGKIACVTQSGGVIYLLDISDPMVPRRVGSYETGSAVVEAAIAKNLAYIASPQVGVTVLNIANPANPRLVTVYPFQGGATSILADGHLAYVGTGRGVTILDVSQVRRPKTISRFDTGRGPANGMTRRGRYLFVHDDDGIIQMIDVSNPARPVRVGSYRNFPAEMNDAVVAGSFAYLADTGGLHILDLRKLAPAPRPKIRPSQNGFSPFP